MERRLINITELSRRLGFTIGTLYHWAHEGKIPCVRPNDSKRCLRFDPLAIEEWIQANSTPAARADEKKLDIPQ